MPPTVYLPSGLHVPIDAADLVITLGYDLVEYHPRLWNHGSQKKIVHIDFLPAEVDEDYRVGVEVVGDLAHTLWMLNERVSKRTPLQFDGHQHETIREEMLAEFARHKDDETVGIIRPSKGTLGCARSTRSPRYAIE